jgi:two-component system, cell cycle sensor histidine kinase and response regulator CckA
MSVILLVEDNPITKKMVRYSLEVEGFEVVDVEDGRSAVEAARARRFDLVILDYVLPDIDGLEALAEIRRTGAPELPAIVVTGMVSRLEELRGRTDASVQFLAKPVEPSRLLAVVRAQLSSLRASAPGRRVLVVDDEASNRRLAVFRLRQAGYEVEAVASGAEALRVAAHQPPDAIVSDVMMPGMDGFALCREVRGDPRLASVPVVLVSSAYVDEPDRELARKVGASALVLRTPDLAEAAAALEQCLAREAAPPRVASAEGVDSLHRERIQVQLERQTARSENLMRQAAIHAAALSIIRGLSDVLARPRDAAQTLGDVLVHSLDAAGLSTGLLYVRDDGRPRLQAQFGLSAGARADAENCFGHPELLRQIVEGRQPVALSVGPPAPEPAVAEFLARLGTRSALVVPFVVLGNAYGELVLASDTHDLTENAWVAFGQNVGLQFGQTVALGQSLKRLAESEERYRALMEGASDAILILDESHHVLQTNRAAEGLLGRPRSDLVGRSYDDLVVPEEREDSARVRNTFEKDGSVRVQTRHFLRADGSTVSADVSASYVRVEKESPHPLILVLLRDTTGRERAEAALRAAQDRLAHVVSSSPAVLYALGWPEGSAPAGGDLSLVWISPNVERVLGYTVEEALEPQWWAEHLHPEDAPQVFAELGPILEKGVVEQEYRFRRKSGDYRWMRAELRTIRDAAGRATEVIGSWADVSARKQAELDLVESEEQYRLLFDSNPHPMWVYDAETFAFLAVNEAALRHYGYSRAEWLQMTALDLRPLEDRAAFQEEYQAFMSVSRPHPATYQSSHTFRHRRKDGRILDAEVSASSIVFEERNAWLILSTDVTEKRSLEAQLIQAQKMESIGRLAGGVAHDFNNLLGVISGYGELLRKRVKDEPQLSKYATDIVKAADRAAGLTRQLLAFSRKQVLQPKLLDLNAVVGEMEKMLRRLIGEDVNLVTRFDEGLGTVKADPGQIEQVLMNLAINARDAMPRGGRLTIETHNVDLDRKYVRQHPDVPPGRYAMLAVSDTGEGMSTEVRARAFEPFFTTKEAGKGTGLGLATVHGIVKQSDGHIFVYSEPGRGTSFKIYFPRTDEPETKAAAAPVDQPLPRGTETVLLVEDEATLRQLIRECLESSGYTVLEAGHGPEAMALAERHPGTIDLLMTDVVMPGISGRELAEQVMAARPGIRIVYMSGYTDDAVVLHGVLSEDMAFLQKPFTEEALARKVREVLDARR